MNRFIFSLFATLLFLPAITHAQSQTIYSFVGTYVYDINIDTNNIKWLTTNKGLLRFDDITWTNYTDTNGLPGVTASAVVIDKKTNNLWCRSSNVLCRFDGSTWTTFDSTIIPKCIGYDITVDSLGNVWYISPDKTLTKFDGSAFTNYSMQGKLPDSSAVMRLGADGFNNIWLLGDSGITKFDGTNWNSFLTEPLSPLGMHPELNCFTIDQNAQIWVGGFSGGPYDGGPNALRVIDQMGNVIKYVPASTWYITGLSFDNYGDLLNMELGRGQQRMLKKYDGFTNNYVAGLPLLGNSTIAIGKDNAIWLVQAENRYSIPPDDTTRVVRYSPAPLNLTLSIDSFKNIPSSGASGLVTNISSNIHWTVNNSNSWISANKTNGNNSEMVTFTAAFNPLASKRTGKVTFSKTNGGLSKTLIFVQDGTGTPVINVSPSSLSISADTGINLKSVISSTVNWTVVKNQSWITINKTSGSGNDTLIINVEPNTIFSQRVATITISSPDASSKTVTITQAGALPPYLSVSPSTMNVRDTGVSNFPVIVSSNLNWTASVGSASWISLDKVSGTGKDTIRVTISLNPTSAIRNATITFTAPGIPNKIVQITQSALVYFLNVTPSAILIGDDDHLTDSFAITSNTNWSIFTDQTWLTFNQTNGSGSAAIIVMALENTFDSARTALVTISGTSVTSKTVTVTQNGMSTGTEELSGNYFNIYPNPSAGDVNITTRRPTKGMIIIRTIDGKDIYSAPFGGDIKIDLSNQPQGVYFLHIVSENETVIKKIFRH